MLSSVSSPSSACTAVVGSLTAGDSARSAGVDDRADRERRILRDRALVRKDRRPTQLPRSSIRGAVAADQEQRSARREVLADADRDLDDDVRPRVASAHQPRTVERRQDRRAPVVVDDLADRPPGARAPVTASRPSSNGYTSSIARMPCSTICAITRRGRSRSSRRLTSRKNTRTAAISSAMVSIDRHARHDRRAVLADDAQRHERVDRGRDEDAERVLDDGVSAEARDEPRRVLAGPELDHDDRDRDDEPGERDHPAGDRREDRARGVDVESAERGRHRCPRSSGRVSASASATTM